MFHSLQIWNALSSSSSPPPLLHLPLPHFTLIFLIRRVPSNFWYFAEVSYDQAMAGTCRSLFSTKFLCFCYWLLFLPFGTGSVSVSFKRTIWWARWLIRPTETSWVGSQLAKASFDSSIGSPSYGHNQSWSILWRPILFFDELYRQYTSLPQWCRHCFRGGSFTAEYCTHECNIHGCVKVACSCERRKYLVWVSSNIRSGR